MDEAGVGDTGFRRPRGRQRLPLLRRRLPDHGPRQGRQDPLRRRPRRPGQREPALRQGPLRLRLRPPPAPADQAADPPRRRAQGRDDEVDPGQPAGPTSARRPGRRRWTSPPAASKRSATATAAAALAGFGSAKGSNEEAYLFQKLVRTGFGTNNVDHCTRLCHASSVAALMEGIGSGAVTAPFNGSKNADVIIVIGANPTENHPVAATFFKQFAKARQAS